MRKAIVVGTGAGGATAAKELQGAYDVTILEAGREFRPFPVSLNVVDRMKRIGLLFDEREIQLLFPAMKIRKTADSSVMVNGIGLGGTTTMATGNAVRLDTDLRRIGIDLDAEFAELFKEVPISTDHQRRWRPMTERLFEICKDLNFHPAPLPKMGDVSRCVRCGRCVFGCPHGVKWDSRRFLESALEKGAQLYKGWTVEKVIVENGAAVGVSARRGLRKEEFRAHLIVLAAGGFGTPVILKNSAIKCEKRLFVDPVLCVAAEVKNACQDREISMPFAVQRKGYILAPYFDFLSYFFNKDWKSPRRDTVAMMIKIADSEAGSVTKRRIDKRLSKEDKDLLESGISDCRAILSHLGVNEQDMFLGTINAGHPGGMLPLTKADAESLHPRRLPDNLYIADATLFPASLGNPPILTIMALAKRVCKVCM